MIRIVALILSLSCFGPSIAGAQQSKEFFGMASWYGPQFHGKQTANGEIYNMNELTAAHKTLPFGTILKVTNLKNQKAVVVRVNDRGPFVKNRVLDISKKAAQTIDAQHEGVINIKANVLKVGDGKLYHKETLRKQQQGMIAVAKNDKEDPDDQTEIDSKLYEELGEEPQDEVEYKDKAIKKISAHSVDVETDEDLEYKVNRIFVIQLAAFSEKEKAEFYQQELSKASIETYIAQEGTENSALYKVREKKTYRDIKEVLQNVVRFKKMGLDAFAVGKFFIPKENS